MNKLTRNISAVLILIVVAALLIVPKLLSEKNKDPNASKQNSGDQVIPVDVYVIKATDLENEVSTVGTILANEEVDIKSELVQEKL